MNTSSLEEPDKPFRREESGEARMSELAQGQPDAGRSMPASIILQKLHSRCDGARRWPAKGNSNLQARRPFRSGGNQQHHGELLHEFNALWVELSRRRL